MSRSITFIVLALALCSIGCMAVPSEAAFIPLGHKTLGYQVIKRHPHNPNSFTQGLVYHQGFLLESTGRRGQSKLLKVDLASGKAVKSIGLAKRYFGEGMALLHDKIYQLTYTAKRGFIYQADSLVKIRTFSYSTKGWGLTHNGSQLIMTDGSDKLLFLDSDTLQKVQQVSVFDDAGAVSWLNELEFVEGFVLANEWKTALIAVINPKTGRVVSRIDLTGLYQQHKVEGDLNGIAFDSIARRLFVTGKNWSSLYQIKLLARK